MRTAPHQFSLGRSFALYTARFAEPAFSLIGNPATLFGNLLKHLAPFGAELSSLSMDATSLPNAFVSCAITGDLIARVRVDGVEVYAKPSDLGTESVRAFAEAALAAVHETDPGRAFLAHEITLTMRGRLNGLTYQDFVSMLMTVQIGRAHV